MGFILAYAVFSALVLGYVAKQVSEMDDIWGGK